MPVMKDYSHGVPSWVDLATSDNAAALAFYSQLFDWTSEDMGEESGHYTITSKNGHQVAAISPSNPDDPSPPHWTTYVNVDDIDAVAAKVPAAGGTVLFGPMEVMEAGRMAVFADTTGAVIAAWQPGQHLGAELVNEAGAITWNELSTSDLAKSKAFYSEVFGWGWGGSDDYAEGQVDGRTICGVMPRPDTMPAEVPDNWLVYFGVDDVDAELERAQGLGASVAVAAMDIPGTGRFAVLLDPQGAAFAIFKG
jgi:predicted enzyme related to lactoylglutathione lyase